MLVYYTHMWSHLKEFLYDTHYKESPVYMCMNNMFIISSPIFIHFCTMVILVPSLFISRLEYNLEIDTICPKLSPKKCFVIKRSTRRPHIKECTWTISYIWKRSTRTRNMQWHPFRPTTVKIEKAKPQNRAGFHG